MLIEQWHLSNIFFNIIALLVTLWTFSLQDCSKYMHFCCDKGDDCTRLHTCRYFRLGECNSRFCKRSHNLLESKIILTCGWLSQKTVQNFQILCDLKHNERHQQPWEQANCGEARKAQWPARGRGRGRGRGRPTHRKRDGSLDLLEGRSRERKFDGTSILLINVWSEPVTNVGCLNWAYVGKIHKQ